MLAKMVVLYAHWCPKCSMMMPLVDEIEVHYREKLQVVRIDVEEKPEKMEELGAEIVPTFILYRGENEVMRMAGMVGEETFYQRLDEKLLQY